MSGSAGLIVDRDGVRVFLPHGAVRALVRMPKIEPLPRAPRGVLGFALALGEVMVVVSVGPARTELVVCDWFGESLGIAGLSPVRAGTFAEAPGGVLFEDRLTPTFDLAEVGQLLLQPGSAA